MYAKITSFGVSALDGYAVTVETDISGGLPQFEIVGLPDNAVKESRDRVRSALKNTGFTFPTSRITVNLAPADTKKSGPMYDVPIMLSVLLATKQLVCNMSDCGFVGELSLEGEVRDVSGIISMAIAAHTAGIKNLFVPAANAKEAAVIKDINVFGISHIKEVITHFSGDKLQQTIFKTSDTVSFSAGLDFSDVKGQFEARRALEIAAAGGHNLLMSGSPGTGKSMLAKRLTSILPPLSNEQSIDVTKIYSVAGLLPRGTGLITEPPFRAPHHSVSAAGLSGGGTIPRPGEISLAHHGILFLDELPEFKRDVTEILRQPMEDGIVTISRVAGTVAYPCNIILVAAMNPCPCGYFGHPTKQCSCSPGAIQRYMRKISGPLLDRIDLHVEVPCVEFIDLASEKGGECSYDILQRVTAARRMQKERFALIDIATNSRIPAKLLRSSCRLSQEAENILKNAFNRLSLSARAYDRVLKVSRTIADLDESEDIKTQHVAEAVQYRFNDKDRYYNR